MLLWKMLLRNMSLRNMLLWNMLLRNMLFKNMLLRNMFFHEISQLWLPTETHKARGLLPNNSTHATGHKTQCQLPNLKNAQCFFPKGCHRSSCLFGSLYLKRLATACCMLSKQKTLTPISFKQFCWCFLARGSLNGY